LALAHRKIVVAHVVHDLRDRSEAEADRDATAELARSLGLHFVEAEVHVRVRSENLESAARQARYRALDRLAGEAGCPFVATGHHADDQLETVLMRLARGAGLRGLRGILPSRPLAGSTLVRPMLAVSRMDCVALCAQAGYAWRTDATNDDVSRLRAAIRAQVLPQFLAVAPGAARGAVRAAAQVDGALAALQPPVASLLALAHVESGVLRWERDGMVSAPAWVIGEALRCAHQPCAGDAGLDRIGSEETSRVVRAVLDGQGGRRTFAWGACEIEVTKECVAMKGPDRND
jgi:tRNA(Ile)-lysidine synthase